MLSIRKVDLFRIKREHFQNYFKHLIGLTVKILNNIFTFLTPTAAKT